MAFQLVSQDTPQKSRLQNKKDDSRGTSVEKNDPPHSNIKEKKQVALTSFFGSSTAPSLEQVWQRENERLQKEREAQERKLEETRRMIADLEEELELQGLSRQMAAQEARDEWKRKKQIRLKEEEARKSKDLESNHLGKFIIQVKNSSIFVGSAQAAANRDWVKEQNIQAVINVTPNISNFFEAADDCESTQQSEHQEQLPSIKYLRISIEDASHVNLLSYLDTTCHFMEEQIVQNKNILVHCQQGRSRSCSVIIGFLMKKMFYSFFQAHNLVEEKRSSISLNSGFEAQLKELNRQLFEDQDWTSSHSNSLNNSLDASLQDEDQISELSPAPAKMSLSKQLRMIEEQAAAGSSSGRPRRSCSQKTSYCEIDEPKESAEFKKRRKELELQQKRLLGEKSPRKRAEKKKQPAAAKSSRVTTPIKQTRQKGKEEEKVALLQPENQIPDQKGFCTDDLHEKLEQVLEKTNQTKNNNQNDENDQNDNQNDENDQNDNQNDENDKNDNQNDKNDKNDNQNDENEQNEQNEQNDQSMINKTDKTDKQQQECEQTLHSKQPTAAKSPLKNRTQPASDNASENSLENVDPLKEEKKQEQKTKNHATSDSRQKESSSNPPTPKKRTAPSNSGTKKQKPETNQPNLFTFFAKN